MSAVKSNREGNRYMKNGPMLYYRQAADQGFWKDVCLKDVTLNSYKPFLAGQLYNFGMMFNRHLPKDGRILKAGCGTAQSVVAGNSNDYNCIGLDYFIYAMRKAFQIVGSLRLISGDLIAVSISNI